MLISVVIPAYNSEKYFSETVQSVQAQTNTAWELVIVIDGSRDGTGPLADSLAADDSRIRVVYQENAGVAAAHNRGFAMSAEGVILFTDAVVLNYRLHDSNASGSRQHMRSAEMKMRVKTF